MNGLLKLVLVGVLSGCFFSSALRAAPAAARPLVGAIRFDAWQSGENDIQENLIGQLGPRQWRYRLPAFGTEIGPDQIRMDEATQANIDHEIGLAKAAGIDYFAFNHMLTIVRSCLNLYLSSSRKSDIKFCLMMGALFEARAADAINIMKNEPTYLKVAGGRPLVYLETWYLRSYPSPRSDVDNFRAQVMAAGLPNPYLVAMEFDAAGAAATMDFYGCDAISTYAQGILGGPSYVEQPFATLAANARSEWDAYAGTGRQVIPTVMTGWDPRPDPARGAEPYFGVATPQQIAAHLQDAVNWCAANPGPTAEVNSILMYAWNEISEGGWLVPSNTAFNPVGNGRLDAVASVLAGSPPPPPPGASFQLGDRVTMINGAHSVRSAPDSSYPKIAWIPEGAAGTVIAGPVTDSYGATYYQVRWDDPSYPTGWAYDFTLGLVAAPPPPPVDPGWTYVSDLDWTFAVNSWGPVEKDMSNGNNGAGDGRPITLNGVTYAKGLGVHDYSEIRYSLGGQYATFVSDIGIDDMARPYGSVIFQVWGDGVKLYDSGAVDGTSATRTATVSVAGVQELRLIVTDVGDGWAYDHADWAGARLSGGSTTPLSKFQVGDRVAVIDGAHSVRSAPDSSYPKFAWIPEGAMGTVIAGPVTDSVGATYYQVRWDDPNFPTGWAYDFTLSR